MRAKHCRFPTCEVRIPMTGKRGRPQEFCDEHGPIIRALKTTDRVRRFRQKARAEA